MLRIPQELLSYVDFDEGKLLSVNLPEELKVEFEELKEKYEATKKERLAEY